MQAQTRRVAVVGGNRIPFARSGSRYAEASNQDMLTAALDGLIARFGLAGERLGEVVAGAVLKHSRDFNLTRESVLGSSLSARTPAYDVQQACGTGLEAAILVGADPHVGPCWWNDERAEAAEGVARTNHLAIGADVREATAVAVPSNSRHRIGDISQARRSGGPHVFVTNGLAQLSS